VTLKIHPAADDLSGREHENSAHSHFIRSTTAEIAPSNAALER
jgi:hypothetical protein